MRNTFRREQSIIGTLLVTMLPLLGLVSCTFPSNRSSSLNTSNTIIDWVNFIRFSGITYLVMSTQTGRSLIESDLGSVFATVNFKLEGNVHDPNYQSKDGDAAFLDAGTKVYTVKGYNPDTRLAAKGNNTLTLYEADTNPHAKRGSDLLDIGGKVQYIGVVSDQDGVTELSAIKEPEQVQALTLMILNAPVDQNRPVSGNKRYFVALHLTDGTVITRAYWLDANELARGILLPDAFGHAIEATLRK